MVGATIKPKFVLHPEAVDETCSWAGDDLSGTVMGHLSIHGAGDLEGVGSHALRARVNSESEAELHGVPTILLFASQKDYSSLQRVFFSARASFLVGQAKPSSNFTTTQQNGIIPLCIYQIS